jgi:integrase
VLVSTRMATGRITADQVNSLHPGWDGHDPVKDFVLWDDKLPGFGVKVTPAGAKIYLLQYRIGGRRGKTQRYTIGKEGAFRAASARKEAERLYGLVKQGRNIVAERKAVVEAQLAAEGLAFDAYVREFCTTTLKAEWPKSWKKTQSCLELHAIRHLGAKSLLDITANDVRQLLRRLDTQPATRRYLFAALSFIFNRSKRDGVIPTSPLEAVHPPTPAAERTRVLNDEELRWLWGAIAAEGAPYRDIVEELIYLGQRRGEVAGLPWSELDRERREWHLPAKRAKNKCANVVPLTDRAVAKLDRIAGGEKWPRSGLVYSSRAGTPPSGWSKLKLRLDARIAVEAEKAGAEVEPWTLHDLRRTLATHLQRLGVTHEAVEHLLNHKEKSRVGIARVYQTHGYGPEKRAALERWEQELDRILGGEEGVVIPFRSKA